MIISTSLPSFPTSFHLPHHSLPPYLSSLSYLLSTKSTSPLLTHLSPHPQAPPLNPPLSTSVHHLPRNHTSLIFLLLVHLFDLIHISLLTLLLNLYLILSHLPSLITTSSPYRPSFSATLLTTHIPSSTHPPPLSFLIFSLLTYSHSVPQSPSSTLTHLSLSTSPLLHTHMHIHTHAYTRMQHIYMHTCTHTIPHHTNMHTHTCIYIHTCMHIHTHTHTCIQHTCIHTYMHTPDRIVGAED